MIDTKRLSTETANRLVTNQGACAQLDDFLITVKCATLELDDLRKEVAALRSWKTDAMTLLELYDGLAESVGGSLGMRKTEILASELARLREANATLLEACKRALCFETWKRSLSDENNAASLLDTLDKLRSAIALAEKK